jgi:putative transposase
MPRSGRLVIPNYPHHVIQRGHNRNTVFASDDDYTYYLDNLAQWKETLKCKVYAFCLMTNHVHLRVPGTVYSIIFCSVRWKWAINQQ